MPWTVSTTTIGYTQDPGDTQAVQDIAFNGTPNKVLKIKNITLSLNVRATAATAVYWALVYVPQTQSPSTLTLTSGAQLYEPNQFLISAGTFIADADSEPVRIFTPLARKLHPPSTTIAGGDRIVFITLGGSNTPYQLVGTVKFASQ